MPSFDFTCPACGKESFLRREPIYDGFKKTGERLFCAACGHPLPSENDIPRTARRTPSIFSDDDRPKNIDVFKSDEKGRNCRYCEHYLVNPFTQRCGLHHREVQATDICGQFTPKKPDTGAPKKKTI
jgi:hypothetical protein